MKLICVNKCYKWKRLWEVGEVPQADFDPTSKVPTHFEKFDPNKEQVEKTSAELEAEAIAGTGHDPKEHNADRR